MSQQARRLQESARTREQVEAQGVESDPGKPGTSQASPEKAARGSRTSAGEVSMLGSQMGQTSLGSVRRTGNFGIRHKARCSYRNWGPGSE